MSQSVTKCHKVSQSVTKCHKVSQSVTKCHKCDGTPAVASPLTTKGGHKPHNALQNNKPPSNSTHIQIPHPLATPPPYTLTPSMLHAIPMQYKHPKVQLFPTHNHNMELVTNQYSNQPLINSKMKSLFRHAPT